MTDTAVQSGDTIAIIGQGRNIGRDFGACMRVPRIPK